MNQKFTCAGCHHSWFGRSIDRRKDVRVDTQGNKAVRCPRCHKYLARPSQELQKVGNPSSIDQSVGDLESYTNLLETASKSEKAKRDLVQGVRSTISTEELVDILKLRILNESMTSKPDADARLDSIRRDIAEIREAIRTPSNPGAPTPTDLLVKRIIEQLPLSSMFTRDNPGGLKFNSLDDLRSAAAMFTSKSGRNVLDLEMEKANLEFQARREDRKESAKFHSDLVKGIQNVARDLGWGAGSALSEHMDKEREKRKIASAKPISVPWRPVPGDSNLVDIDCPDCGQKITYELGSSRIVCPNAKCGHYFTVVPEKEHEEKSSRSPGGSPLSRAEKAHPGVESQAPSGDYHVTGSGHDKESHVVVGGGVRDSGTKVIDPGDTKKQKGGKKNGTT